MIQLRLIAQRDITEFVRDGRLFWTGTIMLALLVAALAVGWKHVEETRAERATAQALDYKAWLNQPSRHPHDAAHLGMHVFKPVPPLSIVDPGITPYVGTTIWLQAHRESEVKFRPAQDATGLERFGILSSAWVLQILGPLLVIILGFNSIAGDRDQGILRQVLSLGISPRQILWGKALALTVSLLFLLLPAALVVGAAVMAVSEPGARLDAFARLIWLGLGYCVYLAIFVFLTVAVSARAKTPGRALTTLLSLWIIVAVLAPRVVSDGSRLIFPSETRRQFESSLNADLHDAQLHAWTREFGGGAVWGPGVSMEKWGLALEVTDHAGYKVLDEHFNRLWDSYSHQQQIQEWVGALLPTVALRAFSMGIAGTDFQQHREFSTAAEKYRREIQDLVSHDLVEHADGHGEAHFTYQASTELWHELPPFEYRMPGPAAVIEENWRSLLVLCVGMIISIMFARHSAPREGAW